MEDIGMDLHATEDEMSLFAVRTIDADTHRGCRDAFHDSGRVRGTANLHCFAHLEPWAGAIAAAETQRAQQTNHEEEP